MNKYLILTIMAIASHSNIISIIDPAEVINVIENKTDHKIHAKLKFVHGSGFFENGHDINPNETWRTKGLETLKESLLVVEITITDLVTNEKRFKEFDKKIVHAFISPMNNSFDINYRIIDPTK